jgi:hypothetical protein
MNDQAPSNVENLQQVRNLYFNTTLSQSEIAGLIGISQKTVSSYVSRHNWKNIREQVRKMPILLIQQMNNELREINETIASRPPGERFPTAREAEVRRKIIYSITAMKQRQSAATHLEVLLNFLRSVEEENVNDARLISNYIMNYVNEEPGIMGKQEDKCYKLTETIEDETA